MNPEHTLRFVGASEGRRYSVSTAYATAYSGFQERHKLLQLTLLQQVLRYAISCCSFWAYCKCFPVGAGQATFVPSTGSAFNLSMKAEQTLVRQSSGIFIPRCTARVSAYCNSCNCLLQLLPLLRLLRRWAFTVPAPGIKVCPLALYFEASRQLTLHKLTGKILSQKRQ